MNWHGVCCLENDILTVTEQEKKLKYMIHNQHDMQHKYWQRGFALPSAGADFPDEEDEEDEE